MVLVLAASAQCVVVATTERTAYAVLCVQLENSQITVAPGAKHVLVGGCDRRPIPTKSAASVGMARLRTAQRSATSVPQVGQVWMASVMPAARALCPTDPTRRAWLASLEKSETVVPVTNAPFPVMWPTSSKQRALHVVHAKLKIVVAACSVPAVKNHPRQRCAAMRAQQDKLDWMVCVCSARLGALRRPKDTQRGVNQGS